MEYAAAGELFERICNAGEIFLSTTHIRSQLLPFHGTNSYQSSFSIGKDNLDSAYQSSITNQAPSFAVANLPWRSEVGKHPLRWKLSAVSQDMRLWLFQGNELTDLPCMEDTEL
uniref:Uncharacterized protein n=1 Tax=Salix viminalis TaxID=40686 RepID=A0A6N2KVM4_SALVM